MKKYLVDEDTTLKIFTDRRCIQASFCFRALLKEREIKVNAKRVSSDVPLKRGDEVVYFLTPAREQKRGFSVIYEDENVIAVDKESGVDWEAVLFALSEGESVYAIHRLDRNTEGVLLFAKKISARDELCRAFKAHSVKKVYEVLVAGKMPHAHAVEAAYLKKDEKNSKVTVSSSPIGEKIVTEYEVMKVFPDLSLLKVTLHTGRTHQIRAHLAYLGHPVLGDEKYGDSALNKKYHSTRQRLLSKALTVFCGGELAYLKEIPFISQKTYENFPSFA